MKLTKRQKEVLDFVSDFIEREGYSPSMEEIANHFRFASLNAVFKHLKALQSRGHLRRDPNKARSIELSSSRRAGTRTLSLLGYVAAGKPIEAVTVPEDIAVPEDLLRRASEHFVLKVQGDSMIDEHIEEGDYVIVEARKQAENGEMVVALVDEENVTLKRFYREGLQIRLQPANSRVAPMVLDESRVAIQGVVVGVMRKYR